MTRGTCVCVYLHCLLGRPALEPVQQKGVVASKPERMCCGVQPVLGLEVAAQKIVEAVARCNPGSAKEEWSRPRAATEDNAHALEGTVRVDRRAKICGVTMAGGTRDWERWTGGGERDQGGRRG